MKDLKKESGIFIYSGFDHEEGSGNPIVGPFSEQEIKSLLKKSIQVPTVPL
jgi:hypothetical protein